MKCVKKGETSPGRLVYLSRKKAIKRKALNESELIEALCARGFEVVCPDEIPVNAQLQLMYETRLAIGVHGSYFVNGLTMQPGSHIIDLMEYQHNDDCYQNALEPLGIRYHYLLCRGIGPEASFRKNDLQVNIQEVLSLLDQVLQ